MQGKSTAKAYVEQSIPMVVLTIGNINFAKSWKLFKLLMRFNKLLVNDCSDDPCYIVDLVKRTMRISLETVKIINSLPALNERN